MEWIGGGALILLWMIMSRVQDSLVCLKQINDRLESNELELRAIHRTLTYQGEKLEKAVVEISFVSADYDRHILRPLVKAGR